MPQEIPEILRLALIAQAPKRLLDIGCGEGNLLNALSAANLLPKDSAGADLSAERIAKARKLLPQINFQICNAMNCAAFPGENFDTIISSQVIEHVEDDLQMLREMKRLLAPGGQIYLSTVFKKWYGWYFYRCKGRWVLDPTHIREYTSDSSLLNLLPNAGLELIQQKKELFYFPLFDPFLRRIYKNIDSIRLPRAVALLRRLKVPILGYYNWELMLRHR